MTRLGNLCGDRGGTFICKFAKVSPLEGAWSLTALEPSMTKDASPDSHSQAEVHSWVELEEHEILSQADKSRVQICGVLALPICVTSGQLLSLSGAVFEY